MPHDHELGEDQLAGAIGTLNVADRSVTFSTIMVTGTSNQPLHNEATIGLTWAYTYRETEPACEMIQMNPNTLFRTYSLTIAIVDLL